MIYRGFVLFFLFFSLSANGQTERPRIGVVLSGGSAHGLAHIGVLQYLEEAGIEVDYITGTSMGAVIGGLYAMGYNPDEIETIARNMDWDLMMSNRSPLYEVSPAEKFYHEKIPISLLWNDNSFQLPQGLIRGQKLDLLVSNTFSPAYFIDDFDDLSIPFRCVAVDLENGSIKVFDSGYIGEAIRASMAIPSVFPPKEIDGHIYVDGGLIRNFPVDEIKAMGADIVIGVYVGSKKEKRDKLNTMFDILKQSASMAAMLDSEHQSELVDVLIEPDVKEYGSFDFANCNTFITRGYRAAQQKADQIASLADSLSKYERLPARIKLKSPKKVNISEVKISESDPVFQKMIRNKLKFHTKDETTLKNIEESIALVYGSKNFSKVSYSFYRQGDAYGLNVDTKEVNPYTIGISINRFKYYNTSFILSGEARNVFGKPSRARIDARLSENPGIQMDYLLRIPAIPSYFFGGRVHWDKYELPFYRGKTIDRLYRNNEIVTDISINKEWKNSFLFSLGYRYNYNFIVPQVFKSNDIKKYRTIQDELYLSLNYNSLDKSVFPDQGIHANLSLAGIFNNRLKRTDQNIEVDFLEFEESKNFFVADLKFSTFLHSNGPVCHEFYMNASISSGQSFTRIYKVGGPIQEKLRVYGFLGVDDSELLIGDHLSFKYALRLHLKSGLYVAPAIQYLYGNNYLAYAFDLKKHVSITSYGIILGLDSALGPLALDMGISNQTQRFVVNFGIGFRHIL